ncbi:MAG: response regulator [Salinivirgaceae bacterium]
MMLNLLIIDDDIFFRELIKDILQDYPVTVHEAANGDEGLVVMRQEAIKVVVTDIIMPEKEGLESIIEILQKYPGTKIVAVSGGGSAGSSDYLEMAASLGAHATLAKPFEKEELIETLNQLVDNKLAVD